MYKVRDKFEDIFKQKFDGFKVEPPRQVFQKISKDKVFHTYRQKKRIPSQWILFILFSSAIISGILFYHTEHQAISEKHPLHKPIVTNETIQPKDNTPTTANTINNASDNKYIAQLQPVTKENIQVIKQKKQYYIFAGNDTIICDNKFLLTIHTNLKSFNGQWICSNKNIKIFSPKSKNTFVRFDKTGVYQFIYSGFYNQIFVADTISVMVTGLPPKNRFTDTTICGLNLRLPKVNNIKWKDIFNTLQITETSKDYLFTSEKPQVTQIIREAISENCTFIDTVFIRFNQSNNFSDFSYEITDAFCHQKGKISINDHNNYTYLFDSLPVKNTKIIHTIPGNHKLTIQDKNGCKKDILFSISKTGKILPDFSVFSLTNNTNTPIYFHNKTTIDAINFDTYNNIKFFWDFGDNNTSKEPNPEHTYTKQGTYNVTLNVIFNDECQEKIQKQIVIKPNSGIQYPNVFSPNGDGKNDIFFVQIKNLTEFKGEIFSSVSGEKVFEWTDISKGWNGKINGNNDAPEGIYYFVLKGKDKNGHLFIKKSSLYLKR